MSEATELRAERCVPCRPNCPRMTSEEEAQLLPLVPEWAIVEPHGDRRLRRVFTFRTWLAAVEFVRAIGVLADEEDHHPRMALAWGKVTVDWWTVATGALHRNDFVMAARTDAAYEAA